MRPPLLSCQNMHAHIHKETTDRLHPGYVVCERNHVPTQVEIRKGKGGSIKNTVLKSTQKLWSTITQDKIVYLVLLWTMSMSILQSCFFF